jgi:rubrerythrin
MKHKKLLNPKFRKLASEAFDDEFKKLAEAIGHYECPNCGFDSHTSEGDAPDVCPNCGEPMSDGPGYDTRTNS